MKITKYLLALLILSACGSAKEDPQQIIEKSMAASGSNLLNNAKVEFEFREREYGLQQNGGYFEMVRLWKDDSLGIIRDVVTNDGFQREINGGKVAVADSMASKYMNSINSVLYFALLPYRLNDDAVNKEYLGEEIIKGKPYFKIKVYFDEEGGGKDHDDEFIYWINKKTYFIDFLAYSYLTDGGGMRFREGYNERIVNGVRIVDNINYKPTSDIALENIGEAFNNDELEELSRIILEEPLVEIR